MVAIHGRVIGSLFLKAKVEVNNLIYPLLLRTEDFLRTVEVISDGSCPNQTFLSSRSVRECLLVFVMGQGPFISDK